jgi:hypothetical protein
MNPRIRGAAKKKKAKIFEKKSENLGKISRKLEISDVSLY